jgi:PAS domain S-box-containing protein
MSESEQEHVVLDIDALLVTHELATRPARAPDYAAENRALGALAQELARHPEGVPQRLAELLRELCGAGSAGIAVPAPDGEGFRWAAASGELAGAAGLRLPRAGSPSGEAVARAEVVLLREPGRSFPVLPADPPIEEMLLAPWDIDGEPLGTVWVASHGPECRFDAEDARLLRSLSSFAACAHRATRACGRAEEARRGIEREILQRTDALRDVQRRLADESAQRAAAERELEESHAVLQAAMETETVGLVFYALDGRILDCNRALQRMTGYSREELRALSHWTDLAAPEFVEITRRALAELRAGAHTAPYMKQMVRKDGSLWWAMVAPTCLPGQGDARKCIAFVIDISESRRAEAALAASEERFQALVKGFAQAVWEADADGKVRSDSPSWRQLTGQGADEMLGLGWLNAVHPDDRHFALRHWHEAVSEGVPLNAEFRLRLAGGTWRWTNVRAAPLRNPDGGVARWIGMNIDVDARRQAESALRESDGRFRVLAEASPALIYQFDDRGHVVYAKRTCQDMLGMQAGSAPEHSWGGAARSD